jgi:hypothetical protein
MFDEQMKLEFVPVKLLFEMEKIKNPCLDICQYNDKEICIGCKRTKTESKTWWRLNDDEKLQILENVKTRRNESTDYYGHYV